MSAIFTGCHDSNLSSCLYYQPWYYKLKYTVHDILLDLIFKRIVFQECSISSTGTQTLLIQAFLTVYICVYMQKIITLFIKRMNPQLIIYKLTVPANTITMYEHILDKPIKKMITSIDNPGLQHGKLQYIHIFRFSLTKVCTYKYSNENRKQPESYKVVFDLTTIYLRNNIPLKIYTCQNIYLKSNMYTSAKTTNREVLETNNL